MSLRRSLILLSAFAPLLVSCMMKPIKSEIPHLTGDLADRSTDPNEVKLILYNNSNALLYGPDYSARINVWFDGKALGGPNIGEYIQIQVPKGKHQLELVHLDVMEFRSKHELDAQDDPLIVELRTTPVSNEIRLHKTLPTGNDLPKPLIPYVQK